MSGLGRSLEDYLTIRRALGYRLDRTGRLLAQFVAFCEESGAAFVTVELALAWATLPIDASPAWQAYRLCAVRGFARYLHALDPRTGVPPTDLLPGRSRRAVPYLYSPDEIAKLMAAARQLRSPLRAATFETVIGLLASTGLRIGEALALDRDDLDLSQGRLTVRHAKFNKSREVALHPTAVAALRAYATRRDELCRETRSPAYFVSLAGTRLRYDTFHLTFLELVRQAGLERRSASCRPRPHDFRHTFAVTTLTRWYREGADVAARLPLLSTYLGHVHPGATYWYLSGAPELLGLAAERLETAFGERP